MSPIPSHEDMTLEDDPRHHVLVFVPCWKLRRAHALLRAKGYHARMELAPGYLDVIHRAMWAGP